MIKIVSELWTSKDPKKAKLKCKHMFSFISPTNTKIFVYQLTIKFRQKLMEKKEMKYECF